MATAIGMNNISQTFEFDSKAMRKVTPDERIVVMIENAAAADGLLFMVAFRMLIKAS